MRNILVTGANGQLGNEIRILAKEDKTNIFHFTDVAELDICNEEQVEKFVADHSIDLIINCAAYTAVDKAEDNPEACEMLNATAPLYLANAARKHNASLIHVSTDYVFDGRAYIPYTEDMECTPASVYGKTKRQGEENILSTGCKAIIIRTAWLYSEFGNNFVKTMLRLGSEREKLTVIFDQTGTPTYALDLARAIMHIAGGTFTEGIYHYTNEGVCSWYDFTKEILRQSGISTCQVAPIHTSEYPAKAQRPFYSVLDKTKIKETFGISIPHWTEALAECLANMNK